MSFLFQIFFFTRGIFRRFLGQVPQYLVNIMYKTTDMWSNIDQLLVLILPSSQQQWTHVVTPTPWKPFSSWPLTLLDFSALGGHSYPIFFTSLQLLNVEIPHSSDLETLLFSTQSHYVGSLLYANGLQCHLLDKASQIAICCRYHSPELHIPLPTC